MRVMNLPTPAKKGSVSQSAKPKSTKRRDDSSETCSNIIPYKDGLPPIGNIVLEGSSPPSTYTHSNRHPAKSKPKPFAPRPSMDAPPSSRTHSNKKKASPPPPSATTKRIVCYL